MNNVLRAARGLSRFQKYASTYSLGQPRAGRGETLSADSDNVGGGRLWVRSKASSRELPLPEGSKEEIGHC